MSKKKIDKKSNVNTLDKQKNKLEPPKKFNVVFYNDDYTPMNFVTALLVDFFHKDFNTAKEIMLKIHNEGRAIAGTYSREIAETKSSHTMDVARSSGYPLKCDFQSE